MMAELRGQVRYRFRADEHDVHVVLEGEASWVKKHVSDLGLEGVGWTMPIATEMRPTNTSGIDVADYDDEDFEGGDSS